MCANARLFGSAYVKMDQITALLCSNALSFRCGVCQRTQYLYAFDNDIVRRLLRPTSEPLPLPLRSWLRRQLTCFCRVERVRRMSTRYTSMYMYIYALRYSQINSIVRAARVLES